MRLFNSNHIGVKYSLIVYLGPDRDDNEENGPGQGKSLRIYCTKFSRLRCFL